MDTPSEPPPFDDDGWSVQFHSYLDPTTYSPSAVGHCFISVSNGDRIVCSAGKWPDGGAPAMWSGDAPAGLIQSEIGTIQEHLKPTKHDESGKTVEQRERLHTDSYKISKAQAEKLLGHIDSEIDTNKKYNLYKDNCATWALNCLKVGGVEHEYDEGIKKSYLPTRPSLVYGAIKGLGLDNDPKGLPKKFKLPSYDVTAIDQHYMLTGSEEDREKQDKALREMISSGRKALGKDDKEVSSFWKKQDIQKAQAKVIQLENQRKLEERMRQQREKQEKEKEKEAPKLSSELDPSPKDLDQDL